ncbi:MULTISPECIES: Zn-ribbon domain-containing OB-fold protein [Variovorax]|uniref:Zn-ribbon domain-containing OB-fold protein n=1 Tax=Variovorax paradoxus TaxID=34073 RepID=UPI0019323446|nr:OB-fold domain-containing protein [Variovorax paradoxus]
MNPPSEPLAPNEGARLAATEVMTQEHGLALRASQCMACGKCTFPASTICPFCLHESLRDLPLVGKASLYSFTRVHAAPVNWQTPYALGYADFPNGLRLLAKLADATTDWRADQPVVLKVVAAGEGFRYFLEGAAA